MADTSTSHRALLLASVLLLLASLLQVGLAGWRALEGQGGAAPSDLTAAALEGHLRRAAALAGQAEFDLAAQALSRARDLAPSSAEVQAAAMKIMVQRAAERPKSIRDEELTALRYALGVIREGEGGASWTPGVVCTGHLALRSGAVEEALAAYARAVGSDPGYAPAHLALGDYARRAGKSSEALSHFKGAYAAAPKDLTVLNNLGVQYVDLQDPREAIKLFRQAIAVRDNAPSRINLANALVTLEARDEALQHLRRAAQLAPDSTIVLTRLGELLLAKGELDDAERALKRSLGIKETPEAWLNLGGVYLEGKAYDQATQAFEGLLKARPGHRVASFLLARALHQAGRGREAKAAYRRYLELAGGRAEEAKRVEAAGKALEMLTKPPTPPPSTRANAAAPARRPSGKIKDIW
jgi:tetratricopeptide (TPR) repeat protein